MAARSRRLGRGGPGLGIAWAVGLGLIAGPASGEGPHFAGGRACSSTAWAQYHACVHEARADFQTTRALCLNTEDAAESAECTDEAYAQRSEDRKLCWAQRTSRVELCGALGQAPYDPDFEPADFDPDFVAAAHANPWLPLAIGHHWEYEGGDETVVIDVLAETKRIEGVPCVVVHDVVLVDGVLHEDTDDWLAQRLDGTVDYCGESVRNFESFPGDDPERPELVDVDGSWKAGREGARPGTQLLGAPVVGAVYRQEWAPGDAEDAAVVLSTTYAFGGADPELDDFVPRELAEALCAGDCVVTGEFTPLEPDVFQRKYYAPGVGLFLEVDPGSGDVVELVACNVDPVKCAAL